MHKNSYFLNVCKVNKLFINLSLKFIRIYTQIKYKSDQF